MPLEMLKDAVGQCVELDRVRVEQRTRDAHRIAGSIRVVAKCRGLRASSSDVLFRMGLRVSTVLFASVGRDVPVERRLSLRCKDREFEAEASISTLGARAPAAKPARIAAPDSGELTRVERPVVGHRAAALTAGPTLTLTGRLLGNGGDGESRNDGRDTNGCNHATLHGGLLGLQFAPRPAPPGCAASESA